MSSDSCVNSIQFNSNQLNIIIQNDLINVKILKMHLHFCAWGKLPLHCEQQRRYYVHIKLPQENWVWLTGSLPAKERFKDLPKRRLSSMHIKVVFI